jgi:hypothetical protein
MAAASIITPPSRATKHPSTSDMSNVLPGAVDANTS